MKKLLPLAFLLLPILPCACERDSENIIDKLPGTWFCEEHSSTYGPGNYYVDITRSSLYDNQIVIDNFYHLGTGKNHIELYR